MIRPFSPKPYRERAPFREGAEDTGIFGVVVESGIILTGTTS